MSEQLFSRFENLITWVSGDQRAPHKPLLVLLALGEWSRSKKELRFSDVSEPLTDLLRRFGPARKTQHPEYPFWRLQRDGVWEVYGIYEIAIGADGGATKGSLLAADAIGRFTPDIQSEFAINTNLIGELANRLLETHFPASIHEDILDAIGLEINDSRPGGGGRDPNFRKRVLTAYQHQCAVCGLQLLLAGSTIALEAAHIRWHQAHGPAVVQNGLCLCTLHHKLYDLGVFCVERTRLVFVSDEVSGLVGLTEHLLAFNGKPIRSPIQESHLPATDYLDWHIREVFRGNPRPV